TVILRSNYASDQDVLSFTNQLGITGSFNSSTGVLTLSGTTTLANYQTALRAVKYRNSSDNPSTLDRTIAFQINDGSASNNLSTLASRTITVTAVNDPPGLAALESAAPAYTETAPPTPRPAGLAASRVDSR